MDAHKGSWTSFTTDYSPSLFFSFSVYPYLSSIDDSLIVSSHQKSKK